MYDVDNDYEHLEEDELISLLKDDNINTTEEAV
jgi:hypothetical protein